MTFPTRLLATFALAATIASPALAQTPAQSPREACRSSAISLCPTEAMSGDMPGVRACLMKNIAKASPECQAAVKAAQAKMAAAKAAAAQPSAPAGH